MTAGPCERCWQPYDRQCGSADPLCPAGREQVATWTEDDRLTALAQRGFEETMGVRPPDARQAGYSTGAWFRASRVQPSAPMTPQQVTSWPDGKMSVSETVADYVIEPGQVRCRHCATSITPGPDGGWADVRGSAACFSPDVPHVPLPSGLDGSG